MKMELHAKVTGIFPKTNQEVLETYELIKEKLTDLIKKPTILISLDTGIGYVFKEISQKYKPEGNITA